MHLWNCQITEDKFWKIRWQSNWGRHSSFNLWPPNASMHVSAHIQAHMYKCRRMTHFCLTCICHFFLNVFPKFIWAECVHMNRIHSILAQPLLQSICQFVHLSSQTSRTLLIGVSLIPVWVPSMWKVLEDVE